MNSKVSLVVPVYNMADTVGKCLESILDQTYRDIEIILINDGSTDNSAEICSQYQNKDKRIRYYSRENRGLSLTYREGIDRAEGSFLVFVDSDDYVDSGMVSALVGKYQETDADIVETGIIYEGTNHTVIKRLSFENRCITEQDRLFLDYFFTGRINRTFAGNLFKKCLFDGVEFKPGARSIDLQTLPFVYAKCKKFVQIEGAYYHAVMSPESVSRGTVSDEAYNDKTLCTRVLEEFFHEYAPKFSDYMYYRHTIIACTMYEKICRSSIISDKEAKKQVCLSTFNQYYKSFSRSELCKQIEKKERIKIKLFRISPALMQFVLSTYAKLKS